MKKPKTISIVQTLLLPNARAEARRAARRMKDKKTISPPLADATGSAVRECKYTETFGCSDPAEWATPCLMDDGPRMWKLCDTHRRAGPRGA